MQISERKEGRLLLFGFLFLIFIPVLAWRITGFRFDSENYENRELSERPKLAIENIEEYPTLFSAYFDDNLPFRDMMIYCNSWIRYYCFNTSPSNSVILGKEGWLFFEGEDGESVRDYYGYDLLTDDELSKILENVITTRDNLKAEGIDYVIYIAPDKERVYSEYMPKGLGNPAEEYGVKQVVDYLRVNTDVPVIYPVDEIIDTKDCLEKREFLYFLTDTHWNSLGGYVGSQSLLEFLGHPMPDISDESILVKTSEYSPGDLARYFNLGDDFGRGKWYEVTGYDANEVSRDYDDVALTIFHSNSADKRKLMLYRDSFASDMGIYIGTQFAETKLVNWRYFENNMVKEYEPDVFVFESVARGAIGRLKSFKYE